MTKQDEAHELTEKQLQALEKRVAKVYKEAKESLDETVRAYFENFRKRDEAMKKRLDAGEITEDYYKQWRLNQIGRGKRFEDLRDKLAERWTKANETAIAYVNDDIAKIYSLNYAYTIWDIKEQSNGLLNGIDFTLYNEDAIKRLILEQPDVMPYYPPKRAVRHGIDLAYGKSQITKHVTSSILQGLSIRQMADNLQERITTMNRVSAIRAARTAVTEAENAGAQAAADRLEKEGVILKKRWEAFHDARVRPEHLRAHGQTVKNSEAFQVGGEKIFYPGSDSMGASPWNIYNCRCRAVRIVAGFKPILSDKPHGFKVNVTFEGDEKE